MSPPSMPKRVASNIFELAAAWPHILSGSTSPDVESLGRVYAVTTGVSLCSAGPALTHKYGVDPNNTQTVVSITNRLTGEQSWFNRERSRKPQNFAIDAVIDDPTVGKGCDFCDWQNLTAEDPFGRVELPLVVSGSNLFKYCEPFHGILLFKKHHPHDFDAAAVGQLLEAGAEWFRRAVTTEPTARHALLIWNCLSRAGASQFHGHAQVMLSRTPFPTQERWDAAAAAYDAGAAGGVPMHRDLLRAARAVGLLRAVGSANDVAYAYASPAPHKDMEIVVVGDSLTSKAFANLLHAALRTLVDGLGAATFNVGILGIDPEASATDGVPDARGADAIGDGARRPVIARIVSRGKLSSAASDFGGLEVFGGASIGHTDPFTLIRALDAQLASQLDVATLRL